MKYLLIIVIFYSIFCFILSKVDLDKKLIKKVNNNNVINSSKRYLNENTSSIEYKRIDNKAANIQIIKFFNYNKERNIIKFNIYLYFFEYKIPNQIKFNLIVSFEIRKRRSNDRKKFHYQNQSKQYAILV